MVVLSRHSLSTRTEENAYSPKYHGESGHSRKGVHSGSLSSMDVVTYNILKHILNLRHHRRRSKFEV